MCVQYRELCPVPWGYLEYRGRCSVPWEDINTMIHVGGYHEYCRGVQYRGGMSSFVIEYRGDIVIHVGIS